ncbi:cellulase family glycosylhydrolase [Nocardioides sp. MH1]|uniref:cellulase family glycosylhydrolase n=1 Tax=Nocardioides sp. MH1 TaxID=3242490 RepID=UPI0035219BFD
MSTFLHRTVVVLVVAVLGVWLLGSRVPSLVDASPGGGTADPQAPAQEPGHHRKHAPSGPEGVADDQLGVQLSAHHSDRPGPALAVLDRLARAGATWVRIDVGWRTLQPEGRGPFELWYVDLLDAVLEGAKQDGLKVILNLWLTPEWASDSGSPYAPPRDDDDYADAIRRAAERWGDDVDAWEIWNEPNFDSFFAGADPATYTRLLCTAYPVVKQYDDDPVLFGGLMYNDDAWLRQAYEAGAKDCFDALATHPYVGPSDAAPDTPAVGAVWRLTHTPAMREVMADFGDRGKRIWVTELGWSSGPDSAGNPWDRAVSPQRQARFLREAVELIRNRYPYVGPIIWYRDVDGPTDDYQDGFGLLHPDLSPKPAMCAFEREVRGR